MASNRRFKVLEHYLDPSEFFSSQAQRHGRRTQFQREDGAEGAVYQKLRPEVIYSLLERADKMHNAAGMPNVTSARLLLERMSESVWTCTATAHEGGRGGAGREPDPYLHFNINFKSKPTAYHVRCHALKQGGLLVFQVTF